MNSAWTWCSSPRGHVRRNSRRMRDVLRCNLSHQHRSVSGHRPLRLWAWGDASQEAEKFKSKLRFVHIKDCSASVLEQARRRHWNFEQAIEHKIFTVIGAGNIDFPDFFRTLARNGYSGWCVVGEQDMKFGDSTVVPSDNVTASLKYLHEIVGTL